MAFQSIMAFIFIFLFVSDSPKTQNYTFWENKLTQNEQLHTHTGTDFWLSTRFE